MGGEKSKSKSWGRKSGAEKEGGAARGTDAPHRASLSRQVQRRRARA